jgi:Outer membrane protein beta-barrel domain
MRTSRILALLAAAFLVVAPAARAQQSRQKFLPSTISLSGGGYAPAGTDLDENDADTGLAVFLNTGYMMSPSRGLQFDLGYFETSGENGLKVSAFPIALSLKLALPISAVEPYVLGGGGLYITSAELEAPGRSVDDTGVNFAPHAAGGINLTFGSLQFGVEARYIWLDAAGLDADGWLIMGKIGTRY